MTANNPLTETARIWAEYDDWNASVLAEFFDDAWKGRPVYLDLEDDVVARIAERAGAGGEPKEAFTRVIRPTLYLWPEKNGYLLDIHLRRLRRWQSARLDEPPPCLAVLAFLSMAADGMRSDNTFRSNNYYARLVQSLGFDPTSSPTAAKKVESDFRRGSLELWNGLNSWLIDHDGALGTPTAYSFDWRSYVGVPITQALLREEERLELRKLFVEFRLQPGQHVATSDMLRLLKEWLPGADVSPTLKRLFQQSDAQGRIADIAAIELQAWDGRAPTGIEVVGDRTASLLLAAQVRRIPRPQLQLSLVVRGTSPVPPGEYVLKEGSAGPAMSAFSSSAGRVDLPARTLDAWRGVESEGAIAFPDLLLGVMNLAHVETGAALVRQPRRLVILERDEEYRIAVEVTRAQLGQENILLGHRSLGEALQLVLQGCARDGFRRWNPQEMRGLPVDWEAWTDVELIELPEVPDDLPELGALIPLEWTKIVFGDGLCLPGYSTWLRDAPPEVRVTSFVEKPVIAILAQTMSLTGRVLTEEEIASFDDATVVRLAGHDLDNGDYRVALREAGSNGKPLVSSSFRLRSGDFPRLGIGLDNELISRPSTSTPLGVLTAEQVDQVLPPFIAGGVVVPDGEVILHTHASIPQELLATPALDLATEADTEIGPVEAQSAAVLSCLMGGSHQFRLPEAGRGAMLGTARQTRIDACCESCGFEKWFPLHRRKARSQSTAPRRTIVNLGASSTARPDVERITKTATPGMDLLIDALTFARGGSWALFERLAQQVGEEPWFALEAARTLSSLGHVDLVVNVLTGRPVEWAVSPPTLCVTSAGAVLCGARPAKLLEHLKDDVEAIGGTVHVAVNLGAPLRVHLSDVDEHDLTDVAESLSAAIGAEVRVSHSAARGIAANLPSLEAVRDALPTQIWPTMSFERFDFRANKWQRATAIDRGGAYKLLTHPLRYGFIAANDGGGDIVVGDNRLVKWMAAQAAGLNLLAYEPRSELLLTRLGAQLPGLYERAAVLSSGHAPVPRVDGTVAYKNVPADIAGILYDRLCVPEEHRA